MRVGWDLRHDFVLETKIYTIEREAGLEKMRPFFNSGRLMVIHCLACVFDLYTF